MTPQANTDRIFRPAPARLDLRRGLRDEPLWPWLLAAAVLVAITLLGYRGAIRGEFLGADHALFQRSAFLVAPPGAADAPPPLPLWAPRAMTTLTFALDRSVWGPLPAGFRLGNLVLHLLTVILVLVLVGRASGRLAFGFGAAALFALHPIHAAAVDVVGERGELLATSLGIASLIALGTDQRGRGAARFALALLLFLGATFASPIALAIPIVVFGFDLLLSLSRTEAARPWWLRGAIYTVLVAPAAFIWLAAGRGADWPSSGAAGLRWWEGVRTLFVPFPLWVVRPFAPATGVTMLGIVALVSALAACAGIILIARRCASAVPSGDSSWDSVDAVVAKAQRRPASGAGASRSVALPIATPALVLPLLLFLVPLTLAVLLPPTRLGVESPFVPLDARLYLASVGAAWLLAVILDAALARLIAPSGPSRDRAIVGGALLASVPLGIVLSAHHRLFTNDAALYAAMSAQAPRDAALAQEKARALAAHGNIDEALATATALAAAHPELGEAHLLVANLERDARDLDAAEVAVRKAIKLAPDSAAAHVTLGLIERERGNGPAAEAAYREAVRLAPESSEPHANLGALLAARGMPADALVEMRRAVALDVTNGDAAANLASFLTEQRSTEEAFQVLQTGLRWSEMNARLHYNLGVALQGRGDRAAAMSAYENAIRLDPVYARPKNNLATLYAAGGRNEEAIALLRDVVTLEPANERAHYNLGLAYRQAGDLRAATAEFTTALRIRPDYPEANRALSAILAAPPKPPAP